MYMDNRLNLQEVTQAIIAFVMVGVTAWVVAVGAEMPNQWVNMVLLVVGFYFGRSTTSNTNTSIPGIDKVITTVGTAILLPFTFLGNILKH